MRRRITQRVTVRAGDLRVGDVYWDTRTPYVIDQVLRGGEEDEEIPVSELDEGYVVLRYHYLASSPLTPEPGGFRLRDRHHQQLLGRQIFNEDALVEISLTETVHVRSDRDMYDVELPEPDEE